MKNVIVENANATKLANLKSAPLKKELNTISRALEKGKKATWEIAQGYANIVNNKLWERDFNSQNKFAEFVGMTSGGMSQFVNAVKFRDEHPEIDTTVSKSYILGTIKDFKAVSDYVYTEYQCNIWELSDSSLKSVIRDYDKMIENKEKEATEEATEEATKEATKEATEEKNVIITIINADGYKILCEMPESIAKEIENMCHDYIVGTYDKDGNKIA